MNISASPSITPGTVQSNASVDSAIARIQKQIKQVQKQIRDVNNGQDDATTKLQLVQAYTAQLTALQAQLAQYQAQKIQGAQASANVPVKTVPANVSSPSAPAPTNPEASRYLNDLA